MKINEVISYLDSKFGLGLQEDYDNCGFLIGDRQTEIKGALIAVDLTLAVVEEAIENNCNLIVTHHPFIFQNIYNHRISIVVEFTLTTMEFVSISIVIII